MIKITDTNKEFPIKDKETDIFVGELINVLEKYKYEKISMGVWIFGEKRNKYLYENPSIWGKSTNGIFNLIIQFNETDLRIDEKKEKIVEFKLADEPELTEEEKEAIEKAKELIKNYEVEKLESDKRNDNK